MTLFLAGFFALVLVPLFIWFGNIAQSIEVSSEDISARTYSNVIRKFRWDEIKEVEVKRHKWFSFHDYVHIYGKQSKKPVIFTEAISDYPRLLELIRDKVGSDRIKKETT